MCWQSYAPINLSLSMEQDDVINIVDPTHESKLVTKVMEEITIDHSTNDSKLIEKTIEEIVKMYFLLDKLSHLVMGFRFSCKQWCYYVWKTRILSLILRQKRRYLILLSQKFLWLLTVVRKVLLFFLLWILSYLIVWLYLQNPWFWIYSYFSYENSKFCKFNC